MGKKASELQKDIRIVGDRVSGKLLDVKGFTEFNPTEPSEQNGHYLVLTLKPQGKDVTIKTKVEGGSGTEVVVDDGYCVYLIKNNQQKIHIITEKAGVKKTRILSLTGLTLEVG